MVGKRRRVNENNRAVRDERRDVSGVTWRIIDAAQVR